MKPEEIRTARLVLDQPTLDDADLVTKYCQDPAFEKFLSTPWPYERADAEKFLGIIVPMGWADDAEYTWAIRVDGAFAGMLGFRTRRRDIGFWLGAPYRGRGYMTEAVIAVLDWAFARDSRNVVWECYVGNANSVGVARKAGFSYQGEGSAWIPTREGTRPLAWKATISATDSREPKAGWPI